MTANGLRGIPAFEHPARGGSQDAGWRDRTEQPQASQGDKSSSTNQLCWHVERGCAADRDPALSARPVNRISNRLDFLGGRPLPCRHDYALLAPRNAGHLDRRKQAQDLAADRTPRQRSPGEGRRRAGDGFPEDQAGCDRGSPTSRASSRARRNWKRRSTTTSSASPPPSPKPSTTTPAAGFTSASPAATWATPATPCR